MKQHGTAKTRRLGLRGIVALAVIAAVTSATAAEPKRVLIINSFGSAAPPFSIHETSFESELVKNLGDGVSLDEVSLDFARYDDPGMQEAMVEYLEKRQASWRPDLIVPIAAPALIFVANHYDRLFPGTPILGVAANQRFLPQGEWEKNAAYVGHEISISGFIEDMLQIAPATKNIDFVLGATSLDRRWREAVQKETEPLAGRIKFTYYNDLSFRQMMERASTLPPDSFIFFFVLLRDVDGVTLKSDEALRRLHQVANAPMNAIFAHQLGTGTVGGRLLDGDRLGKEAAAVAVRILRGEQPASIPPVILARLPPRYDWRELQRWKIDQKLLPPNSTVLYRTPTAWEEHRRLILSVITVGALQALLISGLVINLFRRRRAESSLGESEKRFQTVADATPVLLWMTGEDQGCTFFNKAWLEFTGRSMEQELGRGWRESVHPDDLHKATQSHADVFAARKPFTTQYRLRRHDGEYRWVTDHGMPRYGPRRTFRGYVGACVDITDLLQKEQELHESEERIALAAEAASIGVWEFNPTTSGFWSSDKWRELFGVGPDEKVTYEDFRARVHPEDRAVRDARVKQVIAEQGRYEMEFRVVRPDGTLRWISERAHCDRAAEGAVSRLLGVSVDVTKRKEAEDLFHLATEASPSGTLLVDGKGRIRLVNAHVEELFGYHREELLDQPVEVLFSSRSWTAHPGLRERFLANPGAPELRTGWGLFGRRKDGSEFPIEVGLNPIDTPQGLLVLASVVDVSERQAAEGEARQRREQVELLSRASLLGEMTASLAHELNQPLSAITSNARAGMLFIERGKADSAQLHEIFQDVAADGMRAHQIVKNVRSAIKKGSALRGRISVNQVVETVAHMLQAEAAAQFCNVEVALAENLPAVDGDPTQLQQALINLVSNAFQAMQEVPAGQRKVHISTAPDGNGTVSVSVRDHGRGIAEAAGERIFEQFFTTKPEGLGMGLAIVRSIVAAHGGTIEAENVEGGGAHFRFHLPVAREAPV